MEKKREKGNLADLPFSLLLLRLWQSKTTGRLEIFLKEDSLNIPLRRGEIVITTDAIPAPQFFHVLAERGIIKEKSAEK